MIGSGLPDFAGGIDAADFSDTARSGILFFTDLTMLLLGKELPLNGDAEVLSLDSLTFIEMHTQQSPILKMILNIQAGREIVVILIIN
jgi:hypothetical protein